MRCNEAIAASCTAMPPIPATECTTKLKGVRLRSSNALQWMPSSTARGIGGNGFHILATRQTGVGSALSAVHCYGTGLCTEDWVRRKAGWNTRTRSPDFLARPGRTWRVGERSQPSQPQPELARVTPLRQRAKNAGKGKRNKARAKAWRATRGKSWLAAKTKQALTTQITIKFCADMAQPPNQSVTR